MKTKKIGVHKNSSPVPDTDAISLVKPKLKHSRKRIKFQCGELRAIIMTDYIYAYEIGEMNNYAATRCLRIQYGCNKSYEIEILNDDKEELDDYFDKIDNFMDSDDVLLEIKYE